MRSQMCRRPVISDHTNEKSKEIMHGPVDQQATQVILIKIKSPAFVSPKVILPSDSNLVCCTYLEPMVEDL